MSFACPHCGYDGSRPATYGPEPFTYFELVPRWQRVRVEESQLVVDREWTFGDDGEPLLRCNDCDREIDALPPLHFEDEDDDGESEAPPRCVLFVYPKDAYFCPTCTDADPGSDDVFVYLEGVSDTGFTGFPTCAACARVHDWVIVGGEEE